ncbi:hypothetical protein [Cupriavidus sp. SW-Y-13]|uniref:hypothetical protein n=1 Tax=Cupriavidus sp. SW-Y-13 TaxID=2653854 RepID=UPI00136637A3|nr:hypothetical protein [Cupriavidus sp. SW-Y-13]MWL87214.1 hypothetical protein [Cupriavidus sp. SW-Y-13]
MSVIDFLGRLSVLAFAFFVAYGMICHLVEGYYPEYFWPIVAYLATALSASAALLWPHLRSRNRWALSGPFILLTLAGFLFA